MGDLRKLVIDEPVQAKKGGLRSLVVDEPDLKKKDFPEPTVLRSGDGTSRSESVKPLQIVNARQPSAEEDQRHDPLNRGSKNAPFDPIAYGYDENDPMLNDKFIIHSYGRRTQTSASDLAKNYHVKKDDFNDDGQYSIQLGNQQVVITHIPTAKVAKQTAPPPPPVNAQTAAPVQPDGTADKGGVIPEEPNYFTKLAQGGAKSLTGTVSDWAKKLDHVQTLLENVISQPITDPKVKAASEDRPIITRPFKAISESIDWANKNAADVPEGFWGGVVQGVSGILPEVAMASLMPHVAVEGWAAKYGIMGVNDFAMLLGAKGALTGSMESQGQGPLAQITEPLKQGAKGFEEGLLYAGVGVVAGKVAKSITNKIYGKVAEEGLLGGKSVARVAESPSQAMNRAATEGVSSVLSNALLFGGYTALEETVRNIEQYGVEEGVKKIDWNNVAVSTGVGLGLGVKPLFKGMMSFASTPRAAINKVAQSKQSPEEMKAMSDKALEDLNKTIGKVKQTEPIDQFKLNEDIFAAQKRLNLPSSPEVLISDATMDILGRLQKGESVETPLIEQASNELYGIRKGLEGVSKSETRKFTTDQIFQKTNALGSIIETLENAKQAQLKSGSFIDAQNKHVVSAVVNDNLATLKGFTEEVIKDPAKVKQAVAESSLPDAAKQDLNEKIDQVAHDNDPVTIATKPITDKIDELNTELQTVQSGLDHPAVKQIKTAEIQKEVVSLNNQLADKLKSRKTEPEPAQVEELPPPPANLVNDGNGNLTEIGTRDINTFGREHILDKPQRSDFVTDKDYADAQQQWQKNLDDTILSINEEGTITTNDGQVFTVTVGGKWGTVVTDAAGHPVYAKGKRAKESPFTNGFKFKPSKSDLPQPSSQPAPDHVATKDNTPTVADKTAEVSPYGTIASDYLLNSGSGSIIGSDYFLQALSGSFEKAGGLIESIRNKYSKEIADANLGDINKFIGTDLYNKITAEIKDAIDKSYSNKAEATDAFERILKHPTGLPHRLGMEVSSKLDALHKTESISDSRSETTVNRVFDGGTGMGRNNPESMPTKESSAYRNTGESQIRDIIESGFVRPRLGKIKGGKRGEVHWSRGNDNLFYYDKSTYVLETDVKNFEGKKGALSIDDISAIWKLKDGKWENVIDEIRLQKTPKSDGTGSDKSSIPNTETNGKETQKGREEVLKPKPGKAKVATDKVAATPPEGLSQEEFPRWAAKEATDPKDILIAHEQELGNNKAAALEPWQQDLLEWRFDENSFNKFGDQNNTTFEPWKFRKAWFQPTSKGGLQGRKPIGIDDFVTDQEGKGRTVSESQVTQFISDHPTGHVRKTTDLQAELARKYKELTGKSIDQGYRERAAEQLPTTPDITKLSDKLPDNLADIVKKEGLDINNIDQFGDNSFIFEPGEFEIVKKFLEYESKTQSEQQGVRSEVPDSPKETGEGLGAEKPGPLEQARQDRIAAIDAEVVKLTDQRKAELKRVEKVNSKVELPLEVAKEGELLGAEQNPVNGELNKIDRQLKDLTEERTVLESKQQQTIDADNAQQDMFAEPAVTKTEPTPASTEPKTFTESKDLNAIYKAVKEKYGDKKGAQIYDAATRLVNPNQNTIVEVRSNGVIVKEGDKFTMKPFTNTDFNSKKWELGKGIDVTDQFGTATPSSKIIDRLNDLKTTNKKLDRTEGATFLPEWNQFIDNLIDIVQNNAEFIDKAAKAIADFKATPFYKGLTGKDKEFVETELKGIHEEMKIPVQDEPVGNETKIREPKKPAPTTQSEGEGTKERKFYQSIQANPDISAETKAGLRDNETARYYVPKANIDSLAEAQAIIEAKGHDLSEQMVKDKNNDLHPATRTMIQNELITQYDALFQKNYGKDKVKADYYFNRSEEMMEFATVRGTEMGQAIQAYAHFTSPAREVYRQQKEFRQAREKKIAQEKPTIDKSKTSLEDINKDNIDKVLDSPAVKKVVEKTTPPEPRRNVPKEKIAKERTYRDNLLKNYKREDLFTAGGLNPRAIELIGNMTASYVREGFWRTADIASEIAKTFKKKYGVDIDTKEIEKHLPKEVEGKSWDDVSKSGQEAEMVEASEKLATRIVNHIKEGKPKEFDPIKEMVNTLFKKVSENTPQKESTKRTDMEKVTEAIQNKADYADTWEKSKLEVDNKIDNLNVDEGVKQDMKDQLQAYYDEIIGKPFAETQIKGAVRTGLKDLDINIRNIIREHYTVSEASKRTLVDKLIEDAGLTGDQAKTLADAVVKEFDRLTTKAKIDALNRALTVKGKVTGKQKTIKQTHQALIELSNLGAFSDAEFTKLYAEKMGFPALTQKQALEISRLAEIVQQAPQGRPKSRAVQDLLAYEAKLKGLDWGDVGTSMWYTNMLSGYTTQEKNLGANVLNFITHSVESAIYDPARIPFIMKSFFVGHIKGAFEAYDIFKTGYTPIRGKMVEIPGVLEQWTFAGGKFNPANYAKYVMRFMYAADALSYEAGKSLRSYEMAKKIANERGIKAFSFKNGKFDLYSSLWKEVDNILHNTKEDFAEVKAQAEAEGYKGNDKILRTHELMEQRRSAEIIQESQDFAAHLTFNHNTEGTLGWATDAIGKFINDVIVTHVPIPFSGGKTITVKPGKFIVPFTRIISNVANRTLDWVPPVALYRAAKGGIGWEGMNKQYGDKYKKYTSEERVRALIRAGVGIAGLTTLYYLTSKRDDDKEPVMEITAKGTGDWGKNAVLQAQGWQPYSIKVGGKWYSYQYTPLFLALAPLGYLRDAEKHDKDFDEKSWSEKLMYSQFRAMGAFSDMSFLGSVANLMTALFSTKEGDLDRYFTKLGGSAKSFVMPNLYTQLVQGYEEIYGMPVKDTPTLMAKMFQDMPYMNDKLYNKLNIFGDPIPARRDIFTSDVKKQPAVTVPDFEYELENGQKIMVKGGERNPDLFEFMVRNKTILKPPKRESDGLMLLSDDGKSYLPYTDKEYNDFMFLRGRLLKENMTRLYGQENKIEEIATSIVNNFNLESGHKERAFKFIKKLIITKQVNAINNYSENFAKYQLFGTKNGIRAGQSRDFGVIFDFTLMPQEEENAIKESKTTKDE